MHLTGDVLSAACRPTCCTNSNSSKWTGIDSVLLQAVAPGSAYGRAGLSHGRSMGRAAALVFVCGLAACVALLGGIGDAEEPVSQAFLAVKAEIQSKPVAHLKGKVTLSLFSLFICCLPSDEYTAKISRCFAHQLLVDCLSSKQSMALAAKANSFSSTASGIMQEVHHSKVFAVPIYYCLLFCSSLYQLTSPPSRRSSSTLPHWHFTKTACSGDW